MRHVLVITFAVLSLCSYGIVFVGSRRMKKIIKKLNNLDETEVVDEEYLVAIKRGGRMILIGIIPAVVFGLASILLLYGFI